MKKNKLLIIVVLVVVALVGAVILIKNTKNENIITTSEVVENVSQSNVNDAVNQNTAENSVKTSVENEEGITYNLYYFMTSKRCSNCLKIESYTKDVFDKLNNDKINFEIVDVEKKENNHFIPKYGLYTKSVVISKLKDGNEVEYKNLDKIWNNLGNEAKFKEYVETEINNFIGK